MVRQEPWRRSADSGGLAVKAGAQGDESEAACLSIAVDILPDDTTRNCQRCYRYAAIRLAGTL